jgi:hypothetical protein
MMQAARTGRPRRDLTGMRRGALRVMAVAPNGDDGETRWHCQCRCGRVTVVRTCHLTWGKHPASCGRCNAATKWTWWAA